MYVCVVVGCAARHRGHAYHNDYFLGLLSIFPQVCHYNRHEKNIGVKLPVVPPHSFTSVRKARKLA
jgi:hypothetical protein